MFFTNVTQTRVYSRVFKNAAIGPLLAVFKIVVVGQAYSYVCKKHDYRPFFSYIGATYSRVYKAWL